MKHKNLVIVFFAILLIGGVSCNQQTKSTADNADEKEQAVEIEYSTVETILQNGDDLSGQTVNVRGIIDHVCRHGNNRFKILSSDGTQELKIELGDNFKMVTPEIAGQLAKVVGTLVPVQMNAEKVKAWEENVRVNHAGEEDTEHFKQEILEIQNIYNQLITGEIPFYIEYSVEAERYELE